MPIKYDIIEDGELLKWEKEGMKLEGVLVSYRTQVGPKGEGHIYEVKTKDGVSPFFAPSLLHKKLQSIAIGNVVSINFTETTKTGGGNDLKHFEVGQAAPTEANLKAVGVEMLKPVTEGDEGGDDFDNIPDEEKK